MGYRANVTPRIVLNLACNHHPIKYELDAGGYVVKITLEGTFVPSYIEGDRGPQLLESLECLSDPKGCSLLLGRALGPVGPSGGDDLVHSGKSPGDHESPLLDITQMDLPLSNRSGA